MSTLGTRPRPRFPLPGVSTNSGSATVTNVAMWGIHNDALTYELVDQGFVSIGWDAIGDLRKIGPTRQDFKEATLAAYPDS